MTMRLLLCCAVVAGDAKRRRLEGRRRRRECLAAAPQVPARRVVAADLVREAREALRRVRHIAAASGGKLDAQLAQPRARGE